MYFYNCMLFMAHGGTTALATALDMVALIFLYLKPNGYTIGQISRQEYRCLIANV